MRSVSVVVCTRDRPAALARCLRSLADEPADEVVVVDNGSAGKRAVGVGARVVHEPVVGLSVARNRGLADATSEVVLFVDDDATAIPGLVEAHRCAYEPGVVAAGGPVRSVHPPAPRWLDPSLAEYLSEVDRGEPARDLGEDELPFGANLSVLRSAALAAGGFDVGLGRRGRDLASGEELDLLRRLAVSGGRIRWCPDAAVDHHLPAERLRLTWLLRRAWAQGASDVALQRKHAPGARPAEAVTALRYAWTALRPGGTWAAPPPPLPRRAAVEAVRRVRLLGAAASLARR